MKFLKIAHYEIQINKKEKAGDTHKSSTTRGRSGPTEVFLGEDILKICSRFTGEHPCRSVISIKLLCHVIEITFRHGCSPVNLLHIFSTLLYKNSSVG